jgi:hypothetical protein
MAKRQKPEPAKIAESERCLHMRCQQWLEKSGIWSRLLIFHVPNERRGGIGAMVHFKRLGVRPGVADYIVINGIRDAAIELKDSTGKQKDAQKQFQRQWEATGKLYYVVRTLEDFQVTIEALTIFS